MTAAQMIQREDNTKNNELYIGIELSNSKWKLMFGNRIKKRLKVIRARDLKEFEVEIAKAIKRFNMEGEVKIFSCYEAGRDGFWFHRHLTKTGIENHVVDSSSIEVNRRRRRAKTDRVDANKLVDMLISYVKGEEKRWSVVRVPSEEAEDVRRLNREIDRLKKERSAHTNRIGSLLILHGIEGGISRNFPGYLETLTSCDGKKVPKKIKAEILREYERYKLIQEQLKELEKEKEKMLEEGGMQATQVKALQILKGIGPISAWNLVFEFFGWRRFNNGKQVGAAAGLVPTPYNSGDKEIEQGISKSGNRRIRSMMIELGWFWLRYQPESKLSKWFHKRFGSGKRIRRIGIVALARKLLIDLWRYLETGVLPEGAILK